MSTITLCALRHHPHPEHLARYRCSGCEPPKGAIPAVPGATPLGPLYCLDQAYDGRQWNRRGELVHLIRIPACGDSPAYTRVCGTLQRVEDALEDVIEPIGVTEP